ncbi:MAG: asparagine synthase (glutamine-hydrolyzing) [Nitrospirae bacterium]|nr:asparagine synthase (glutamine-hydrolyzing) [Nitrospirota bacterium]
MCGIAGIFNFNGKSVHMNAVKHMTDKLYHRGPDDEGFYLDGRVALGHRRLSIIDLSPAGHQPMCNEDGAIWLTYNGEIYNYQELTSELKAKGHVFSSRTDSEVIIHAYEEWGAGCLGKFNGMWAFALWDSRKKELFCARDRFGIKPFYYYLDKGRFVFASEIKSILTDETIPCKPGGRVIFDFLAYENNDYIDHAEETFFERIKRLRPAHYMVVKDGEARAFRYWELNPEKRLERIPDREAAQRFYELFEDSVRLRLRSDVPLGTCLSGGLDSSSIVCIANKLIFKNGVNPAAVGERQKTFSACFDDKACDEREFINAVIEKTNVETNRVFPRGEELFELAPKFIEDQGEPVAGTSQWAGWLVMRLVKSCGVTVVLNGQGADEILAGYGSYFLANFKDLFAGLRFLRLANELNKYSRYHGYPRPWLAMDLMRHFAPFHPFRWKRRLTGEKEPEAFPLWLNRDFIKAHKYDICDEVRYEGHMDQSLYHFLCIERLPSLLRYEDRNSMAFSVEARLPFLDYRLVEFCFSLPSHQKIRDGAGKLVLRNALKGVIPEVVRERIKKVGFDTPEALWFRSDCRRQIEDIINSKSFRERGYFDAPAVAAHFRSFVNREPVNPRPIWKYVNTELWLRNFFD